MSLFPGTRIGPYEVIAAIGAGGMGEVYRAADTNLKRDVAIKVLPDALAADPDRLARFQREAQVLAALNHPNIAQIYGVENTGGRTALVMELVDGRTLEAVIAAGHPTAGEALSIARQIADALEAAHEVGIVHRDLKPANIKVREDGTVKVLDFGLAKALDSASVGRDLSPADLANSPTMASPAMTGMGIILGTAAYMSPEQARGRPVDRRADIWAFGCVLYEMLTGRRPFPGEDITEILASVVKDQPDLERVPPSFRRLLGRCLEKDPKKRLRHIGDAWDLLDGEADPAAAPAPPRTPSRRWALAGAGLAAVVVLALWWAGRSAAPLAELVRLDLLPPPGTALVNAPPAVSPDGRSIAFVAREDTGRNMVYIRRLDASAASVVPGTEGALFTFWSPDGQALGFTSRSGFKRVALAGGPARVLYAGEHGSTNGTWNEAGDVLFYPIPVIGRVAASGGAATPVTKLNAEMGETSHRFPYFLPGGKHFLFYVYTSDASGAIALGTLGSLEHRTVLPSDSAAVYTRVPGKGAYLLYRRESSLMAQRFDETAGTVTGEPAVVADDVGGAGGAWVMPALSVSPNGVLAYAPEAVGRQRRLVWFDRQGNRVGELPAQLPAGGVAGSAQQVRLSPDGTRLAYVRSADGGGPTAVWVADLQSGRTSRVTFGEGETAPLWTPDGESLCYVGRAGDGYEIRVRKLGGGERVLLSGRGRNRVVPLDWSPDGQFLAIADMNALKLLPLRHTGPGQPELIDVGVNSGFSFPQARFSPDGNYLAMVAAPGAESEIHVMPMPPGSGTWTLAKGTQPTWRSDGRELFYLEADMSLTSIDVTGAESFQTGSPRPLFTTAIDNLEVTKSNSYEVAPGGQRFLIRVPEQGAVAPLTVVMNWWAALKD